MDIISATAFLDLFSRELQIDACERMISFLKPFDKDRGGAERQVIFGSQMACLAPGYRDRGENVPWGYKELFIHDLDTFKQLWKEVGEKTGTKWEFEGCLKLMPWEKVDGIVGVETARLMEWAVWRVG